MNKQLAMGFAASQMGFLVVAGLLGGLWVDRQLDTTPWMALLGLVAGFASGIKILIALVKSKKGEDES